MARQTFEELLGFSPLTGIPWFPTYSPMPSGAYVSLGFQSPDGDSVVSHRVTSRARFQLRMSVSVP